MIMNMPSGSWPSSIVRRRRCRFWGNMSAIPTRSPPTLSTAGWLIRTINTMIRDVPRRWPPPVRSRISMLERLCPCTARPSCSEAGLTACPGLVTLMPARDLRTPSLSKRLINPFAMIADLPRRNACHIQKVSKRISPER